MPALSFLAALLLIPHAPRADDFPNIWQEVSSAISTRYYARETRKAEMQRLLAKYKPIASGAKSRDEFTQDVNDMIAEFKDSHFAFYSTADQGFYVMDGLARPRDAAKLPNIGAYFRHDGDGYTVGMILNGSAAEKTGLRKGDRILEADGKPFRPVASFDSDVPVRLNILRDGQRLEREVKPEKDEAMDMFLDATRESVRVIPDHGRKIGYIHLWTLANDRFKNALAGAVYGKLIDTDACILDLRDGFGGRPEGFSDPFFRPEMSIEWESSPKESIHEEFGYQRPLIVLINGGSRSAKEVLSQILKKSKRATLVGSTTAGNVLGTFPMRIGDWAYLEIPMVDVISDGIRLEGRGIEPNVPLPQEYDASGKDLYLEKALDMLKDVKARA